MDYWKAELEAWNHIQSYHLDSNGKYKPLLPWSSPVEEVGQMHQLKLCNHPYNRIYSHLLEVN